MNLAFCNKRLSFSVFLSLGRMLEISSSNFTLEASVASNRMISENEMYSNNRRSRKNEYKPVKSFSMG
jgi:hypothetical protein